MIGWRNFIKIINVSVLIWCSCPKEVFSCTGFDRWVEAAGNDYFNPQIKVKYSSYCGAPLDCCYGVVSCPRSGRGAALHYETTITGFAGCNGLNKGLGGVRYCARLVPPCDSSDPGNCTPNSSTASCVQGNSCSCNGISGCAIPSRFNTNPTYTGNQTAYACMQNSNTDHYGVGSNYQSYYDGIAANLNILSGDWSSTSNTSAIPYWDDPYSAPGDTICAYDIPEDTVANQSIKQKYGYTYNSNNTCSTYDPRFPNLPTASRIRPRYLFCAFEDPGDSPIDVYWNYSPIQHGQCSSNTSSQVSPYDQAFQITTSAPIGIGVGLIAAATNPAVAVAYGFIVGIEAILKAIAPKGNLIVERMVGCVDVPLAPSPPPFFSYIVPTRQPATLYRICSTEEEAHSAALGCVVTSGTNTYSSVTNSFRQPTMLIGFTNVVNGSAVLVPGVSTLPTTLKLCNFGNSNPPCFNQSASSPAITLDSSKDYIVLFGQATNAQGAPTGQRVINGIDAGTYKAVGGTYSGATFSGNPSSVTITDSMNLSRTFIVTDDSGVVTSSNPFSPPQNPYNLCVQEQITSGSTTTYVPTQCINARPAIPRPNASTGNYNYDSNNFSISSINNTSGNGICATVSLYGDQGTVCDGIKNAPTYVNGIPFTLDLVSLDKTSLLVGINPNSYFGIWNASPSTDGSFADTTGTYEIETGSSNNVAYNQFFGMGASPDTAGESGKDVNYYKQWVGTYLDTCSTDISVSVSGSTTTYTSAGSNTATTCSSTANTITNNTCSYVPYVAYQSPSIPPQPGGNYDLGNIASLTSYFASLYTNCLFVNYAGFQTTLQSGSIQSAANPQQAFQSAYPQASAPPSVSSDKTCSCTSGGASSTTGTAPTINADGTYSCSGGNTLSCTTNRFVYLSGVEYDNNGNYVRGANMACLNGFQKYTTPATPENLDPGVVSKAITAADGTQNISLNPVDRLFLSPTGSTCTTPTPPTSSANFDYVIINGTTPHDVLPTICYNLANITPTAPSTYPMWIDPETGQSTTYTSTSYIDTTQVGLRERTAQEEGLCLQIPAAMQQSPKNN